MVYCCGGFCRVAPTVYTRDSTTCQWISHMRCVRVERCAWSLFGVSKWTSPTRGVPLARNTRRRPHASPPDCATRVASGDAALLIPRTGFEPVFVGLTGFQPVRFSRFSAFGLRTAYHSHRLSARHRARTRRRHMPAVRTPSPCCLPGLSRALGTPCRRCEPFCDPVCCAGCCHCSGLRSGVCARCSAWSCSVLWLAFPGYTGCGQLLAVAEYNICC